MIARRKWGDGNGEERRASLNRETKQQKETETERNTPQEIDKAQQKAGCGCLGSRKIEHPSVFMRTSCLLPSVCRGPISESICPWGPISQSTEELSQHVLVHTGNQRYCSTSNTVNRFSHALKPGFSHCSTYSRVCLELV